MAGKLRNRLLVLVTEKERQDGRNINFSEIANAAGVSVGVVSRWMRNDVSRFDADVVEKLCDYFQCDVGDLLYIDRSEEKAG